LTPLEAIDIERTQYHNAWAAFATQYNTAADESHGDDDDVGLGDVPDFVSSNAVNNHIAAVNGQNAMDLDGGINDEMFETGSSQRSPASVAESLQDQLDGHGEDAETHVPPVVHTIQADRSFTPRLATPAAAYSTQQGSASRKNRGASIQVYQDPTPTSAWVEENLRLHSATQDVAKENDVDEMGEADEQDVGVMNSDRSNDRLSSSEVQSSRRPLTMTTVTQRSFEAPTLRQESEKRTPAKRANASNNTGDNNIGDDDTIANESEEDGLGEDETSDGDESHESDIEPESSPRQIKDEPVSSSAAR